MKASLRGSFIEADDGIHKNYIKLTAIDHVLTCYSVDGAFFRTRGIQYFVKGITPDELVAIINDYEIGIFNK